MSRRRNDRRPTRLTVRVGGQNMTEGAVTDALRACSVFIGQETAQDKVRFGFGPSWRHHFSPGGHTCISWDTGVWQIVGEPETHRFHGSGKGDPDIPDAIATPARFLLVVRLRHRETGVVVTFFCTWLLNSWNPVHGDRWTKIRRAIVRLREMPVVRRRLRRVRKAGELGVGEGDMNSVKAALLFSGWITRPKRGLDRFFFTRDRRLRLLSLEESATTGVGPQMRHKGLVATFEIGD